RSPAKPEILEQLCGRSQKQRLNLCLVQPGEVCAVLLKKRPASAVASLGHHRNSRAAQGFHVSMDRALGDLESFGKLSRSHLTIDLKEEQYLYEPVSAHGDVRIIIEKKLLNQPPLNQSPLEPSTLDRSSTRPCLTVFRRAA